ncbi:hypothetical protein TEA_017418 [Camellia sinensis var. sinensis]|uniref:Protein kinase domain-containing protein n=1 Tax=Camellia sinensis var. sinensis TaxID=542762 RepID=A0A4S4E969_CAMSN|nr:hypothetical protein TEA_017418 [Camellia sinensis var. sinensis]
MHLLDLFKRKAEEEQLLDIVDKYNDNMQTHRAEVVEMIRVVVWCLQSDFSRRPSMSVVVKVLEGSVDVQNNLDYNFTTPVVPRPIAVVGHQGDAIGAATLLFASTLSGPSDKDQSQVVTMMRGTPGYLAPEWFSSIITKKVDFYSFGVMVLEMLCGRKNLDRSQLEEDMHLLDLFKRKAEEERLLDIVDKYNDNMQTHRAEVVEMMRVVV